MRVSGRHPATGESISVIVEGGLIRALEPGPSGESLWLSPGLVDLQVNGGGGIDLNAGDTGQPPTSADVAALARLMAAGGVTTFAPTLITASEPSLLAALASIARAREESALVHHMIPFVHVEGPFLSPLDGPRGAHPASAIRPPDLAEVERWQAASGGLVGLVTVSPHWPGIGSFIAGLVAQGIRVSLGHTHAESSDIRAAIDAGARFSTHLGNGVQAILPRHPNLIWEQLADDRVTAMFIADGHHLPSATLKAMLRAKGLERSVLVSDAVALCGLPPGLYHQPIGGTVELTPDGRLGIPGTPFLAGAALPLRRGVATVARLDGFGLDQAIRLATENPGRIVGGRGMLAPGWPADLIRFRWEQGGGDLDVTDVIVAGTRP